MKKVAKKATKKATKKTTSKTVDLALVDVLRDENKRLRVQNERLVVANLILLEGCALIREEAVNRSQSVGYATRLTETIFKVMRSDEAMEVEIDRRLADPRRSWWNEKDKEMFPEPSAG